MHFFRPSRIHLDCFTYRKDVIDYAPVVNAIEAMPQWWRELPKDSQTRFTPTPTMRTCVGMIDYYKNSVALPLWSDLCLEASHKKFEWQFSDGQTVGAPHAESQFNGFSAAKGFVHLKIESPWLFISKDNLNWMMSDPIYSRNTLKRYMVGQGLLNFSKQHNTHIQLFVDTAFEDKFILPFKTNFLFTPLSDKKVVVHRHLIDAEEYSLKNSHRTRITFLNAYRTQQRAVKCPYKDETK
jgi:hypothetical protein